MTYCKHCGNKLDSDSRFCPKCGTEVTGNSSTNAKTRNCPNCGHAIFTLSPVCPACGCELQDLVLTESKAAKELADQLAEIDRKKEGFFQSISKMVNKTEVSKHVKQKESVIRNYPVPNTKQDLYELFHMAAMNVNYDLLEDTDEPEDVTGIRSYLEQKLLAKAWKDKMDQIYHKAEGLFGSSEDFRIFKDLYGFKKTEHERVLNKRKKESRQTVYVAIVTVVALVMIGLLVFFAMSSSRRNHDTKENELRSLVEEVNELILNDRYDEALLKANLIVMDSNWSSESVVYWDQQRESLIRIIKEKQAQSN